MSNLLPAAPNCLPLPAAPYPSLPTDLPATLSPFVVAPARCSSVIGITIALPPRPTPALPAMPRRELAGCLGIRQGSETGSGHLPLPPPSPYVWTSPPGTGRDMGVTGDNVAWHALLKTVGQFGRSGLAGGMVGKRGTASTPARASSLPRLPVPPSQHENYLRTAWRCPATACIVALPPQSCGMLCYFCLPPGIHARISERQNNGKEGRGRSFKHAVLCSCITGRRKNGRSVPHYLFLGRQAPSQALLFGAFTSLLRKTSGAQTLSS